MKDIIKELKINAEYELRQIGMTPRTNFVGTQKEHDEQHRQKANDYEKAIKVLSTKPDLNKRKFNLNELRHIAVNFAITCEKGYKGDFDSWFNGISGEWRKIANRK